MSGLELTPTSEPVGQLVDLPSVRAAVSRLVEEVVVAAYEPGTSTVDVSAAVTPLASRLAEELQAQGVPVETRTVRRALDKLPPIVLEPDGSGPGLAERVDRPLTTAAMLAAVTMATAAALLLGISRDRMATARSLALRVAVSALSFAFVLRVGAWIADPGEEAHRSGG